MADQKTDDDQATGSGMNPNMAVQKDAKPQRVLTGGMWSDDADTMAGLDGKDQAQNKLGG